MRKTKGVGTRKNPQEKI